MTPESVRISVALITRNRPASLERCLRSLRSQSVQPYEVVISDDSDAEVAGAIATLAQQWDCRYLVGPHRGMQANRNQAHRACQGTHIRTMDDDHEFPPDHCATIQRVVEADPASVWIFSEYLEWPTPTSVLYLPGEIQPRGFRRPIQNPDDCFGISDGFTIYPQPIFQQQGFLESLKYAGEVEFAARLKALGYRIRYCPDTYIIHHCLDAGGTQFEDKAMLLKSLFLGAYLTYAGYLPNPWKSLECWLYFLGVALRSQLSLRRNSGDMDPRYRQFMDRPFNLHSFWQTWQLSRHYKQLFQAGRYGELV